MKDCYNDRNTGLYNMCEAAPTFSEARRKAGKQHNITCSAADAETKKSHNAPTRFGNFRTWSGTLGRPSGLLRHLNECHVNEFYPRLCDRLNIETFLSPLEASKAKLSGACRDPNLAVSFSLSLSLSHSLSLSFSRSLSLSFYFSLARFVCTCNNHGTLG